MERRSTRIALGIWVALVLAFLYVPIILICVYAFNSSNVQSWPIAGLTTHWFSPTIHDGGMQQALWLSLEAAGLATTIALILGSMAAFGVHRFRFFGREAISFLLVLPIALPGIITGMALELVLHVLEGQLLVAHDRDRARHVLRRRRLQQHASRGCVACPARSRRRRWISGRRGSRPSVT